MATNTGGGILWNEHFDPYGQKLNGVNEKIGYTGHAYDAETQLTYAQARFYDPAVGRFLSNDPVGFTGSPFSFNRYSYVNNNPYGGTDPTGMAVDKKATEALTGSRIRGSGGGNIVHTELGAGSSLPTGHDSGGSPTYGSTGGSGGGASGGSPAGSGSGGAEGEGGELTPGQKLTMEIVLTTIPIPGVEEIAAAKLLEEAVALAKAAKTFSKEKQALIDMAKFDKRAGGATREDMRAYEQLNKELPDPFPSNTVRVDEGHIGRGPHSEVPHGHVGPVGHIEITDP